MVDPLELNASKSELESEREGLALNTFFLTVVTFLVYALSVPPRA